MATTPPTRTKLNTPPTPLHGARYDAYQPYQTRKSTRQITQRAAQTPPPQSPPSQSHLKSASKSRKTSATRTAVHTYSPPSSTQASPQKKLFNTGKRDTRGVSKMMQGTIDDPFEDLDRPSSSHRSNVLIGASMLPTPAKTPRKKPVQAVAGLSRVLFPVRPDTVEEAMPTSRKNKRTKRHVGFSLDSSMDDDAGSEGGIKIYTDSKDTIPELDQNEKNPFIDHPLKRDPPEPQRKPKASKKRKVQAETIDKQEIEEAFDHEEGMVYVFRGRKFFKRFPSESSPQPDALVNSDSELTDPPFSSTHFTRSSIKPRLLFPSAQQQRERQLADEEATTDIEQPDDSEMTDLATDETEIEEQEARVVTPVKTSFMPASPPDTGHATRSATKKAGLGTSPLNEGLDGGVEIRKGRRSPFDGWARRKAGVSAAVPAGKGKKRPGETIEKGDDSDGGVPIGSNGRKKARVIANGS